MHNNNYPVATTQKILTCFQKWNLVLKLDLFSACVLGEVSLFVCVVVCVPN